LSSIADRLGHIRQVQQARIHRRFRPMKPTVPLIWSWQRTRHHPASNQTCPPRGPAAVGCTDSCAVAAVQGVLRGVAGGLWAGAGHVAGPPAGMGGASATSFVTAFAVTEKTLGRRKVCVARGVAPAVQTRCHSAGGFPGRDGSGPAGPEMGRVILALQKQAQESSACKTASRLTAGTRPHDIVVSVRGG
jgi:hypothetical protein